MKAIQGDKIQGDKLRGHLEAMVLSALERGEAHGQALPRGMVGVADRAIFVDETIMPAN